MTGGLFTDYDLGGFYDEAVGEDGLARTGQGPVVDWFDALSPDDLRYHAELRDDVLRSRGITFTVYGEAQGAVSSPVVRRTSMRSSPASEIARSRAASASGE